MDTGSRTTKEVHDPVCDMRFRPQKAAAVIEHGGRRIYFCTHACRRQFEEHPERYVTDAGLGSDAPRA